LDENGSMVKERKFSIKRKVLFNFTQRINKAQCVPETMLQTDRLKIKKFAEPIMRNTSG